MDREMKRMLADIEIPSELRERTRQGVKRAKQEMRREPGFIRRRLMTVGIAAALLIPTGAFAYQSLLADELYGSFDEMKVHIVSATLEKYLLLDAKLNQAKGVLGEAEYKEFERGLSTFTDTRIAYGNTNGNVDYEAIPKAERAEVKQALADLQPYFDQLNDQPAARDVLTADEYDAYIEALMREESIRVRAGEYVEDMPDELRQSYEEALAIIREVNRKQQQN
ncbi:DUF3600 domain-containing protein [Exiguobacterium sp. BG5(2022)]|uniref:DUF3600 domain-containing protein n=1 Tax=Exiguobacterium sp. BG5(2022) TaxID=2962595 RepID=UPI0028822FF5|nr:DUF3600 domain-containing protein [Exiguobacterium sp. BG5(2022)]MDT0192898.1 DUF3600 domain-containing protein [Exiguobacterium sp. BG5(2022)]